MAERLWYAAAVPCLLLMSCTTEADDAKTRSGITTQALSDAGRDARTEGSPGILDAAADVRLPPPLTPDARYDFVSSSPALVLTRVANFALADLPDKSVDPPAPHEMLSPSDIEFFPNDSGDLLIVLSTGLIVWLDRDFSVRGTFQVDSANTLAKYLADGKQFHDNEGVLGLTFDPHFAENGWFYLHIAPEHLGGIDIYRLRWKPDQLDHLWDGRELLFHTDKPQVATDPAFLGNHDGGNPSFGPDGYLYVAVGDGGIGGGLGWDFDPAQDLSSFWGKLLRVDPSVIGPPEIVAYGLRNPFTHTWRGNELFIGDVSADWNYCWDEIDRYVPPTAQSAPPVNFGWPLDFGPCADRPPSSIDCSGTVDPVHGYRKDDTRFLDEDPDTTFPRAPPGAANRSAIILGPAYPGGAYGGYLDNVILYGDLLQGWIRGLLVDDSGRKIEDKHLIHHDDWCTGMTVGRDAHIYTLGGFGDAFSVYRVDLASP